MLNNSCGGNVPWGESYTCYIDGHANDKVTVSASSVPCRTENINARSCWVWRDVNWGTSYNIYRIDIDDNYLWSEPWLGYYDFDYSLWAYAWNDMIWTVTTSGYPFPITSYLSESRTDIRNGDDSWVTTDQNWTVHLKHKKVAKRVRYLEGGIWHYYWESTATQYNFRKFQIGLTKGTGSNKSSVIENAEFKDSLDDEYDFVESIDLKLAQKIPVYSMEGLVKNILSTTTEEENYLTSIVVRDYSDGRLAAFEIEKIDEKIKNELNFVLEGKTIIAVNGFKVDEFKNADELFKYLFKEEVRSITFLDGKMVLYEIEEK